MTGHGVGEAADEAGHAAGEAAGEAGPAGGEAAAWTGPAAWTAGLSARAPCWASHDDKGIGFASGTYSQVHYYMLLQTLPCWMKSY